jgi:2-desacetyl-2-hydroxyethyl bacteriochlorophyllide A dehydrogenase
MSAMDKRVVFPRKSAVELEEFELGEPQQNEVLIDIKAQLMNTGTELANLAGITKAIEVGEATYPIRPGGSGAGVVAALGAGVTDLKVGDRVLGGGQHATRTIVRREGVRRIPEGVSFEEATFPGLCTVGMQGIRIGQPQLGEIVVVIGAGIIGALAQQFAMMCGAGMIVVVDLSPTRLRMARELGADATINPAEADVPAALGELTGGEMADLVIEATGNPRTFPMALKLARERGRIVALGSPRGNVPELDLYTELHCKGLMLLGAHNMTHPSVETPYNRWTRTRDAELALELIRKKRLPAAQMITHRFRFDDAVNAYRMLVEDRTQALGVLFVR